MKEEFIKLLKTFIITVIVAFVATNQENKIYKVIEFMGIENEVVAKTIFSAVIAFAIGVVFIIVGLIWKKTKQYIKRPKVNVVTKIENSKRTTLKFAPSSGEYIAKYLDIEVKIEPGSHLNNFLLKHIGITLDVYFNPEILDVTFSDKWELEVNNTFNIIERKIRINLLNGREINGAKFNETEHILREKIIVKPIRVKDEETSLDYIIISKKFNIITRFVLKRILKVKFESLKVSCKGDL